MRVWLSLTLMAIIVVPASAAVDDKVADRLYEASKVVDELVKAADSAIPKDFLKKAQCIAVIPGAKGAGLGIGVQVGRGAVSCRQGGAFGSPSMISIPGGSFGFQIGGKETDFVMLFMTPDSLKRVLHDKVTIGVDAAAAGGPKGREAAAETSPTMRAEILTYSRARGAFAGISVKSVAFREDKDANKSLYNRPVQADELLEKGVAIPAPAQKFVDALSQAAR
jgi:lipid-binding SYLF domain-containing protein